jgi:hypothetical protein
MLAPWVEGRKIEDSCQAKGNGLNDAYTWSWAKRNFRRTGRGYGSREGGKTVITYWCRKWFGGEVEKRKWARNFKTADLSWPTD